MFHAEVKDVRTSFTGELTTVRWGKSSLEGLCRLFIGYGFESTDHQYREFNDLLSSCSKLKARAVKISWVIALYLLSAYALVIQK